jgi:hypothetical protein
VTPLQLARALRRRWLVLLVGMVATALVGLVVTHPRPTYNGSEVFAIQPPATPRVPNQLTGLGPSLALTGAAVARRLKSPARLAELRRQGMSDEYDVVPRNSGTTQNPSYWIPSIQILVTGHDEAQVLRSVATLFTAFQADLEALQDEWGVATSQRITTTVLAPPSAARLWPRKSRALAGVGLLGAAGSVAVALWCEEVLGRRRGQATGTAAAGTRPAARRRSVGRLRVSWPR